MKKFAVVFILLFLVACSGPQPAILAPSRFATATAFPPATLILPTITSLTPTATPISATITSFPPTESAAPPTTAPTIEPTATSVPETPIFSYEIINTYPHDPGAFTQGLIIEDGVMLEGTGQWGASSLREVNWQTGEITQFLALPAQYFGEGITVFDDKIYQLTWRSQTGFIFNRESFELLKTFTYPTEGWGITHDGRQLIMSDGTSTLYFRDPETLVEIGRLEVYDENGPVVRLNELEFVEGEIWANIWETDFIARISPESGQVLGWIDLTDLLPASMRTGYENVLNGIAYDAENGRIFVTGKWWPALFEIELVEQPGP